MNNKIQIPEEKPLYSYTEFSIPKRQITVNFTYTVNMGNYESAKILVGLTRDLGKEESVEETIDNEFEFVQEKVLAKIEQLISDKEN